MKSYMTRIRMVVAVGVMMVASVAQAGTAGYTVDPPIMIAMTNTPTSTMSNYWENKGGQEIRIVDVTSTATGGTLNVYVDLMYGGAGLIYKPVCAGATLSVTNSTSRSLTGGSADYVSPGQRVVCVVSSNIAAHKILLRCERKD